MSAAALTRKVSSSVPVAQAAPYSPPAAAHATHSHTAIYNWQVRHAAARGIYSAAAQHAHQISCKKVINCRFQMSCDDKLGVSEQLHRGDIPIGRIYFPARGCSLRECCSFLLLTAIAKYKWRDQSGAVCVMKWERIEVVLQSAACLGTLSVLTSPREEYVPE